MATALATQAADAAEEWRDVIGYAKYRVSSLGNVWSGFSRKILKPGLSSNGYLCVVLYTGITPKDGKSFCVHDLVAAAFIGPKPEGYQVDHGREGKLCNAVHNLEYVTGPENMRRAATNGLIKTYRGASHTNSKLTDWDVRFIRRVWPHRKRGTVAKLGRRLGVDPMTVYYAGMGRSYREVKSGAV